MATPMYHQGSRALHDDEGDEVFRDHLPPT